MRRLSCLLLLFIVYHSLVLSQSYPVSDPFLRINAGATAPLYTTYTAPMERARLYGDKGYKMDHYSLRDPLTYGSEHGGRFFCIWEINDVVVDRMSAFAEPPVVTASFPDMAVTSYSPWPGIQVEEAFVVYSSSLAFVEMTIRNHSQKDHRLEIYPVLQVPDSFRVQGFSSHRNEFHTTHFETRERLISGLYGSAPYPTHLQDLFGGTFDPFSFGSYEAGFEHFYNIIKTDFYSDDRSDSLNLRDSGEASFIALHARIDIPAGGSVTLRYYRGIQDISVDPEDLRKEVKKMNRLPVKNFLLENEELFSRLPRINFETEDEKLVYLSSFNLLRGCMLPPAGETSHNFYVFSREPIWGWGHGHQVLHESLSMLAYAYLDPLSAQGSQRVYMEQQGDDGLIAYRHGPRGPQTYPHKGKPTTSAPFFSWINWEVYLVSGDNAFLRDAYHSGKKYTRWLLENRDTDNDSTFEWGPYGIIENVRDWYNAVFQVSKERYLDVDKEDISDELECLDLSLMIVKEMRSLASMAGELGLGEERKDWIRLADGITAKINERMWHEESGFFYHVDKDDHSFRFMTRDLKRQEIIGFLPMWAEAVSPERAEVLMQALTDTSRFWRRYGVPTLSARDPWYSPYVDYCCKWNGPVWLLWDYMVFDGLVNYGYEKEALELAGKMMQAVTTQLSENHNFWESFSPDNTVLNCPSNYIWDGIMARLLIDVYELKSEKH